MGEWNSLRSWRPVVMGRRGAVASNHPLATEVGVSVLRRGGNAADGYLAAAATLAVVEPQMSGVGGEGFATVFSSRTGDAVVVNGSGRAPLSATPERFAGGIPERGPMTMMVPGLVDCWCEVHRRFCTLPLRELLEPAIYYAREGFGATRALSRYIQEASDLLASDPLTSSIFLPGGAVPSLGKTIRQPALARTLEMLADGGREAFYEGETARGLAGWMAERGGLLGQEDLKSYRCLVQAPIETSYRGMRVLEAPPNSTGFVLLQELNVVEQFDLAAMRSGGGDGFLSAELIHTLVEIKKLCFVDREGVGGEPREAEELLPWLLSKEHASQLAGLVDPNWAVPRPVGRDSGGGDTTYLAVADGAGNAISGIQSLNQAWGAAVIAGETGILLNNRLRYFHLEPGHPNRLAPGKLVRHTMNPPMVLRDGRPYIVFGTPGRDAQVQVNLQVLTAMLDFELDPQQAVEMPRWHSLQPGTDADWPHRLPDQLVVESRVGEEIRRELEARGHRVVTVGPLDGPCSENVLRYDAAEGLWHAGSDPRRDAYAVAF